MILPFLLDVPLGIMADKLGARILLISGTLMQVLSLVGFFILPSNLAYIAYLFSIIVAENCYSGAEQSFLKENLENITEVKEYLKELNQYFYYITIPALFFGVILFNYNPLFPLYAQLFSFLMALLFIIGYSGSPQQQPLEASNHFNFSDLKNDIKILTHSPEVSGLVLFGILFSAGVQISAKVIQGQIDQSSQGHSSGWLALTYILSNITSGSSLLLFRNFKGINKMKTANQMLIFFSLFVLAQLLMLNNHVFAISVGFILLSGVKSIYRPIISGELIHNLSGSSRLATKLSVISTTTTLGVASFHVLGGYVFTFGKIGTFIFLLLLSLFFVGAYTIYLKQPVFRSYSGKTNEVLKVGGVKTYRQSYPEGVELPDFGMINEVGKNWKINIPQVIERTENSITFDYINHEIFSLMNENVQTDFLKLLLNNQKNEDNANYVVGFPQNGTAFLSYIEDEKELHNFLANESFIKLTHGDLNPNNILVSEKIFYVVDWDLFDWGYVWFDGLSILTHPEISVDIDVRIRLIQEIYQVRDLEMTKRLYKLFCQYKAQCLFDCSFADLKKLATIYRKQAMLIDKE